MGTKLYLLSDLHLEFGQIDISNPGADIVILAGDIHIGEKGIVWARHHFKKEIIIFVAGNHEYYHGAIPSTTEAMRKAAIAHDVHFLENGSIEIGNLCFIGATLWTDFNLFGRDQAERCMAESQQMMTDFRLIRFEPEQRLLVPKDIAAIHRQSCRFFKKCAGTSLKKIIISHHCPSRQSVPQIFKKCHVSAAFASNLDEFIEELNADLWVHGHTHTSFDYKIGGTRIIANPKGYPHELNPRFIPDLTLEL